ncbi:conserved Plasmodium protein, unknown function [Plasmodium berghei ANKA]|uniref:Uncharacterized protein n=1 Tax=Plasmodium berghei (strain Anka) TaxID=5823 RepID=A0A509API2_PLABA|nr:conserved Plasmodium protein, unknown function [Plasmodium berghei ANKA]VUC57994.1 conserved Plasmodium protein, unknown function [Plasmodium berghei ANKA]|eukprot:XP_034423763.1 conserved Plasmodium protein, unknown function [Plasmodium berghei ANKA]
MKKTNMLLPKRSEAIIIKKSKLFFLSTKRYETTNISIQKNDDNINISVETKEDIKNDNFISNNKNDGNAKRNIENDYLVKYHDENKNLIKTTNYILKIHLRDNIFVNQKNNFYNYFYNSYPFIINNYISQVKENYLSLNDIENENNRNKKLNDTPKQKSNYEIEKLLHTFLYYNKDTKNSLEDENFLNIINNKMSNLSNASELLKWLNKNVHLTILKTGKNKNEELSNKIISKEKTKLYGKFSKLFQNIINNINDTNDMNKKIEILLYLINICNKNIFPQIYEQAKTCLEGIYEKIKVNQKKNPKKGIEQQYIMFLLYKNFLSKNVEKYINMELKKYLTEEISFYNYLKNENINICLLSLIYRDLSFINNYEIKYVLMNLAFSKIKTADMFVEINNSYNAITSIKNLQSYTKLNGDNNRYAPILNNFKEGKNNITQKNKKNNLFISDSYLSFFSNTLLKNNFYTFLKNDYIYFDATNKFNSQTDINNTNINNYVFYNLLVAIIQLKEAHLKLCDNMQIKKMKFFLENEKNTALLNFIFKIKSNSYYLNDFIIQNITFFTKYFVKHKINFPNNIYPYILSIYCNLIDNMKNIENYSDIKKGKNLINDSKHIVNYIINEIYYNINLYTLKEYLSLIKCIQVLPKKYMFELKRDIYSSRNRDKLNPHNFYNDELDKSNDKLNLQNLLDLGTTKTEKKNEQVQSPHLRSNNSAKIESTKKVMKNNIFPNGHMDNLIKNNLKTKKSVTIISTSDFIGLTSLPIFNELNEDFVLKIRQNEQMKIREVIPSKLSNNANVASINLENIYEYIYTFHYKKFVNNSEDYIKNISIKYDELTKDQIINYFIFFTHLYELDISDIYVLINIMNQINMFHPFIDFFISKRVENLLQTKWKNEEINILGKFSSNITNKNTLNQYKFSDTYLDDYITKMKRINENNFQKKEYTNNKNNGMIENNVNLNDDNTHGGIHSQEFLRKNIDNSQKHFNDLNLYNHNIYASNFENINYDYDITTNTINLFLSLNSKYKTKHIIEKYLKFFHFENVNLFKINFNHFIQKRNQETYSTTKTSIQNLNSIGITYKLPDDILANPVLSDMLVYSDTIEDRASYKVISETYNNTFDKLNIIRNIDSKNDGIFCLHPNSRKMDTEINHKIIYDIIESRIKYDINIKNFMLNNENKYNEDIKQNLEKDFLSINNIINLISYLNNINDDANYIKLLTLCLKNIILCKNEISDIKAFRLLTSELLNIKSIYQNIYISSEYSYLNMLIKYYIKTMENFIPFFDISDYFKATQIFIKYSLSNKYLKPLIILNNELNNVHIRNINLNFIHIILQFYLKLNFINEQFIGNLLHRYVNFIYQQMENIPNTTIISNAVKTNELLLSLCIKNKDIINLNFVIAQRYTNYMNEFKIDDSNMSDKFSNTEEAYNILEYNLSNSKDEIPDQNNEPIIEYEKDNEKGYDNSVFNNVEKKTEKDIHNNTNKYSINKEINDDITDDQTIDGHNNKNNHTELIHIQHEQNEDDNKNDAIVQNKQYELSLTHKLNIIYFLCKFNFYNNIIKSYYFQLINECLNSESLSFNDEEYCRLYEIYVHVILNFYFLSFDKNNKYINYILSNLPCYHWYKKEEEKLNLFTASKDYTDINTILRILNLNFLTPTLTEIYFIHFFNDLKKINSIEIPQNVFHLYQKYNLLIEDIQNKNVAILCIPEENALLDENQDYKILINESHYVYENIRKTYTTSLLFLSEWKNLNVEEKCDYILRILYTSLRS